MHLNVCWWPLHPPQDDSRRANLDRQQKSILKTSSVILNQQLTKRRKTTTNLVDQRTCKHCIRSVKLQQSPTCTCCTHLKLLFILLPFKFELTAARSPFCCLQPIWRYPQCRSRHWSSQKSSLRSKQRFVKIVIDQKDARARQQQSIKPRSGTRFMWLPCAFLWKQLERHFTTLLQCHWTSQKAVCFKHSHVQ